MPRKRRPAGRRGPGQRIVEGASFRLADEIRYIIRRAANHDGRVVTIGHEPFHIQEADTSFAIDWKGHYRIEGAAFVYTDRNTGRITTVLGYPTNLLAQQR